MGECRDYATLEAMLRADDLDAVWILSPNDTRLGVIVTETGVIVAHTHRRDGDVKADYVTHTTIPDTQDLEVGLALGICRRVTGQACIHVKFSDVCLGAGR